MHNLLCTFSTGYKIIHKQIVQLCLLLNTIVLNEEYTDSAHLQFVTILTILKLALTGSLSAPGFITCTDTVPTLHKGTSVRVNVAVVMG